MSDQEIELIVLRDVYLHRRKQYEKVSPDFDLRRVFREYSKLFHTPLHLVQALPIDDVMEAYLTEVFESYKDEELAIEVAKVVRTPEDLERAQREEDAGEVWAYKTGQDETRAQAAVRKLEDVVKSFKRTAHGALKKGGETELVNGPTKKIQEGIRMVFEPPGDDEEDEGLGIMSLPKKPLK